MAKSPRKPRASSRLLTATRAQTEVFLEISLLHIEPRIWRGFSVPGNIRLDRLHMVIQAVMGWTNSHLHSFRQGAHEYVWADPDGEWKETWSDSIIHDEKKSTLRDLVREEGDRFNYTYDFGDDWEHVLVAKAISPPFAAMKHAVCHAGERACPPEDCGSVPGYEELCAALPDPKHPEHEHWKEWIGDYDPAAFDLEAVNEYLRLLRV